MLKASALVYALFISLLLITLCSAIIMVSHYSSVNAVSWEEKAKVERNAMSGISFLLGSIEPMEKKALDLFGKGNDSVLLSKKSWGAFEMIVSEGFSRHHRFSQVALAGNDLGSDSSMALFLADMDKPLSLCGRTEIRGTCFLPKAGVKRAYIEGQNFVGNNLINGDVKPSERNIAEVNKALITNLEKIFNKEFLEQDSVVRADEVGIPSLHHSFAKRSVVFYSSAVVRLDTNKLSGNIMVISDREVIVSEDAILQDVIICAPKVRIEKKFLGTLQVFASDSIIVAEECHLNYPSVLGIVRQEKSCDNATVIIKEKSEVSGMIFAYQEKFDNRKQVKLSLDKNTAVMGYVYTNGLLDLKGSVFGSVMCSKFILSTPSSVYENHLLSATIDRTKLSKYFVGSSLTSTNENKKVVKWLY
jgi:hypothetical protein